MGLIRHSPVEGFFLTESLILAQDKRWRRVLGMQVAREASFGSWKAANG